MSEIARYVLFFASFLAIVGVIVGIMALEKSPSDSTFSEALLSTGGAIVYYSFGTVTNARMEPGSSDASGSVLGALSGAGTFEVIVHFSKRYNPAPKAVILQAATPPSGIPDTNYLLTVENVSSTGFDIVGSASALVADGVLFYYVVI